MIFDCSRLSIWEMWHFSFSLLFSLFLFPPPYRSSLAGLHYSHMLPLVSAHGKTKTVPLGRLLYLPHLFEILYTTFKKNPKPQQKTPKTTNEKKQVTHSSGNVLPACWRAQLVLFSLCFCPVTKPWVHNNMDRSDLWHSLFSLFLLLLTFNLTSAELSWRLLITFPFLLSPNVN